ncbi:hypothetical protein PSHT_04605 [Puccinia striiformis]|uniref:Secreted protein n=1 Tax=Puccinia striiformis TaxID=27350 RepID=A0A2S4WCG9_9BASI|nr:hypothetical protein H4Q26_008394 [Puccinia striiformis f. sp. tritici PST-130]POW19464.1 hypothetical protein PSHT_04605 [Puccinia striiformis]
MKIIHYSIVLLIQVAFVKSDNFKCIKDSTNKIAPWCVSFFAEDPIGGQAAYYTLDPVTNYSKVTGDPYCEFLRGCCKSGFKHPGHIRPELFADMCTIVKHTKD